MFSKRSVSNEVFLRTNIHQACAAANPTRGVSHDHVGRLIREFAYRCQLVLRAPSLEQLAKNDQQRRYAEQERLAEEYAHGYLEGWQECYSACIEAVGKTVSEKHDLWAIGEILTNSQDAPNTN